MSRRLLDFNPETEGSEHETFDFARAVRSADSTGVLSEAEEMERAAELLELTHEAELDRLLGDLVRSASQAAGTVIDPRTGQALRELMKGAARKVMPLLSQATGFGGQGVADVGTRLARAAGSMFGVELEGLSPEDQEFETAKSLVRFVSEAAAKAANASPAASPQAAALGAFKEAAKRHAPGLLNTPPASLHGISGGAPSQSGRWLRRGRNIVVVNH